MELLLVRLLVANQTSFVWAVSIHGHCTRRVLLVVGTILDHREKDWHLPGSFSSLLRPLRTMVTQAMVPLASKAQRNLALVASPLVRRRMWFGVLGGQPFLQCEGI